MGEIVVCLADAALVTGNILVEGFGGGVVRFACALWGCGRPVGGALEYTVLLDCRVFVQVMW